MDYYSSEEIIYSMICDADTETMYKMIKKGYGDKPLHRAVALSHEDIILLMLEDIGIDIDTKDNYGNTALHEACGMEYGLYMAKFLLDRGADINIKNNFDKNPLYEAASRMACDDGLIKILIERGASYNEILEESVPESNEILHFASEKRKEVVNRVLGIIGE